MCRTWQSLNPDAQVHVAYGGSAETFEALTWPHCTLIKDPRLRTHDHQRERQSYLGVMQEISLAFLNANPDRVMMVECDVFPLRPGLTDYLSGREREEQADVMGARLSAITSKCTSCDHFKVHHFGWGFCGGWRCGWQGGNASLGSFLAGRS